MLRSRPTNIRHLNVVLHNQQSAHRHLEFTLWGAAEDKHVGARITCLGRQLHMSFFGVWQILDRLSRVIACPTSDTVNATKVHIEIQCSAKFGIQRSQKRPILSFMSRNSKT